MSQPDAVAGARVRRDEIGPFAVGLLEGVGAPRDHARIVVEHLLDASAMGLHSHGLIRIPQYLAEVRSGIMDPRAVPSVQRVAPSRLVVDGHGGFGQVVGMALVEAVVAAAFETGMALATGRGLGHTGRVGAYPEAVARAGLIGLAACNGAPSGHWVAPFGGRDGRISTNPIAFAWPVAGSAPVVADFSTGVTAEGVVRSLRNRGLSVPEGTLRDADGRPTTDPNTLYATPRGAIQPMGGPLGYRGMALGLLVEVLTTLLAGKAVDDTSRVGNDMTIIAIVPDGDFAELARGLSAHVRASPPIHPTRPVLMPGDREREAADEAATLFVDGPTWAALGDAADAAALALPAPIDD